MWLYYILLLLLLLLLLLYYYYCYYYYDDDDYYIYIYYVFPFVLYIRVIWVRGSKMRFDEDSAQNRRQKGNPRNDSTMMCAILCYGQNMSKHVKTSQNMSKHVKTCQNMSKMSKHVLFSHTKRSFPHWWGWYTHPIKASQTMAEIQWHWDPLPLSMPEWSSSFVERPGSSPGTGGGISDQWSETTREEITKLWEKLNSPPPAALAFLNLE